MPITARSLVRCVAPAMLAVTLSITAPTTAQFGGVSAMSQAFTPDLLHRDIVIFAENLGLEDWQRPIVEVLISDYLEAFTAGSEFTREQMSEVRIDASQGSNEAVRRLMAPINQWIVDKDALRRDLLESVRMQLGSEQLDRWPGFERALRREKSLGSGQISGEQVNLILLVKALPLDADTARSLETVLTEYEVNLDTALQRREAAMQSQQAQLSRAMVDMDHAAGVAAMEQITLARVGVREAQDQGAQRIAAALPEAHRAEFLRRWQENAYPKVFRTPPMKRTFDAARQLPDLTEAQRTGIDLIESTYLGQINTLNLQMLDTLRVEEPREIKRKAEAARTRQSGRPVERAPDPLAQFDPIRDGYDRDARLGLEALLTPEQYAQLPFADKARQAEIDRGAVDRATKMGGGRPAMGRDSGRQDRPGGGARPEGGTRRPPASGAAD